MLGTVSKRTLTNPFLTRYAGAMAMQGEEELAHILEDDHAGVFFLNYLVTEFSSENYYFYKNVMKWSQSLDSCDSNKRALFARQIGK